jgi:hypothetical protein
MYWGAIGNNGDVGPSNPQWPTSTGNFSSREARGFGNMDLCPICLIHDYSPGIIYSTLTLIAKVTKLDGTVLYWSWNADSNPSWRPDNGQQWV